MSKKLRGWHGEGRRHQEAALKAEKRKRFTSNIYAPYTAGSGGHRWMAEVRDGGWLMDYGYFDTREEAEAWLRKALRKPKMSKRVLDTYLEVARKKRREG